MWTTEIATCTMGCGSEVALITDGRVAYAHTVAVEGNYYFDTKGDTTEVWREGVALMISCPTQSSVDPVVCAENLIFPGEVVSGPDGVSPASYCAPILETRP